MTPADLSRTVRHAVCRAVHDGELSVTVPERIRVDRPRPGGGGDWATNAALALAPEAGRPAREVAELLRTRLAGERGIAAVEITGPGFLNFHLARTDGARLLGTILEQGARYGHGTALAHTTTAFAAAAEPRAAVWAQTLVRLVRSQGGAATVAPDGAERVRVAPVPKGEDPYATLGEDATRWLFLRARPHTVPRVDTSLLVQRESNPLFRVRYAHARTRAVLRDARALGIIRDPAVPPFPPSFPQSTSEVPEPGPGREVGGGPPVQQAVDALLGTLGDHPGVLAAACRLRAPDRVARHLEQTADAVLRYSASCRLLPLGDEKPSAAHGARIALAEAAGTVLACGLSLLGIDAPEHL